MGSKTLKLLFEGFTDKDLKEKWVYLNAVSHFY